MNPPAGVIVTLKVTDCPCLTDTDDGAGVSVKSQPVPVKGTACGLPPALFVIVRVPVRAPMVVGANVTLIVQFAPAAKVAGLIGQALEPVLVSPKSPEAAMELIVNALVPVLVNVTVCAALVVVSNWPPKLRLVGESPTPGAEAEPEPLRLTLND